jgi:alpha-beta hydrolase superfamily lysophospholipase
MIAVHGLSGAALDYEPLGSHLARDGIATYALELRGQGNDPVPQRRGDLERIEDWYADLRAFFVLVRGQHPGVPAYDYGESMGAALLPDFGLAGGRGAGRHELVAEIRFPSLFLSDAAAANRRKQIHEARGRGRSLEMGDPR